MNYIKKYSDWKSVNESYANYTENTEAAKNAKEMVGDDKEPNMFWVSVSNTFLDIDSEYYEDNSGITVIGEYTSIDDALKAAKDIKLDNEKGPKSVTIEDRLTGLIYERILKEIISWEEVTYDESLKLNEKHVFEKKWSGKVKTKWEPKEGIFTKNAIEIAKYLKKESDSLKQAMSRLNYYINRAGTKLSSEDKHKLKNAKEKLHNLYK